MCDQSERDRLRSMWPAEQVDDGVLDSFCSAMTFSEVLELLQSQFPNNYIPSDPRHYENSPLDYGYDAEVEDELAALSATSPTTAKNSQRPTLDDLIQRLKDSNPPTAFGNSIGKQVWDLDSCFLDVRFDLKNGISLGAHRVVLVCQWPEFAKIFEECACEPPTEQDAYGNQYKCVIELPNVHSDVFFEVLRMMYWGCGMTGTMVEIVELMRKDESSTPEWFRRLLGACPFAIPNFSSALKPENPANKYTDFVLRAKGEEHSLVSFNLHRCIVASLNDYFYELFSADWTLDEHSLLLPFSHSVLNDFFVYLYSGEVIGLESWSFQKIPVFCKISTILRADNARYMAITEFSTRIDRYLKRLETNTFDLTSYLCLDIVGDILVIVDDNKIRVSSALLRARVPFLEVILDSDSKIYIPYMKFSLCFRAMNAIFTARPDNLQKQDSDELGRWLRMEEARSCPLFAAFLSIYHFSQYSHDRIRYSRTNGTKDMEISDDRVTLMCNLVGHGFLGSLVSAPTLFNFEPTAEFFNNDEDTVLLISPANKFSVLHSAKMFMVSAWFREGLKMLDSLGKSDELSHILKKEGEFRVKLTRDLSEFVGTQSPGKSKIKFLIKIEGSGENTSNAILAILKWIYDDIDPSLTVTDPLSFDIVQLAGLLELSQLYAWQNAFMMSTLDEDDMPALSPMSPVANRPNSPLETEPGGDMSSGDEDDERRRQPPAFPHKRSQVTFGDTKQTTTTTCSDDYWDSPKYQQSHQQNHQSYAAATAKPVVNPKDPAWGSPYSLLRREYLDLMEPPGDDLLHMECSPDMMHWWVRTRAPSNTPLLGEKGSTFSFGLHFPDDYPVSCPTVQIDRIIHPNFDPETGILSPEALKHRKGYANSVASIIQGVKAALSNPCILEETILNETARDWWFSSGKDDFFKHLLDTICNRD